MFKLLRTFRVVYETKSFSKAAKKLFISQPAVSQQVKQLEEELGYALFQRKGRKEVFTTKRADIFYRFVLNFYQDWQETTEAIKAQNEHKRECKIAASNTFALYYLPELFQALKKQYPHIQFELDMLSAEQILTKIEKKEIDFGIVEKPLMAETIHRTMLLTDTLVAAGDLSLTRWLIREEDSEQYLHTQHYLAEQNLNPERMILKSDEMIVRCLALGLGRALVSKKALPEQMTWYPLEQKYHQKFYFIQNKFTKGAELAAIQAAIYAYYHV